MKPYKSFRLVDITPHFKLMSKVKRHDNRTYTMIDDGGSVQLLPAASKRTIRDCSVASRLDNKERN